MTKNRALERISLDDLADVDAFFSRHSGVDPNNVDPKYEDSVERAKKLVKENCTIGMVYERVRISSHGENEVQLCTGQTLTGKIIPRVLKEAEELYAFVIALDGFNELSCDDVMVNYFADTWASAYTESAQSFFSDKVSAIAEQENMTRTHVWSPGQHNFELSNQQALFSLLKPEDIGCTLTSRLMMLPIKACSGVTGIVAKDTSDMLLPCDFCPFQKDCPASKVGCAAI